MFIVGGISLSEARAAYEVTRERSGWEVIIGNSVDTHVTLVYDDTVQGETHKSSPRVTFSTMLATWSERVREGGVKLASGYILEYIYIIILENLLNTFTMCLILNISFIYFLYFYTGQCYYVTDHITVYCTLRLFV